jgi:hypothetical protein
MMDACWLLVCSPLKRHMKTFDRLVFAALLLCPVLSTAQSGAPSGFVLRVQPVFQQQTVRLNEPMETAGGDTLVLHELRFYLSDFSFFINGQVVFEEKEGCHLIDMENETTQSLVFSFPAPLQFDAIAFKLGIDSATNVSGAMGGDLDPTKGMFWTWQSGYVNFRAEGFYEKCPTRQGAFQFHLGGYMPPFPAVQRIQIAAMPGQNRQLQLDLTPFIDQVNWAQKYSIMSPGAETVRLSKVLATSFSLHAN